MQNLGQAITSASENRPAFGIAIDTSSIVTTLGGIKEARALPPGAIVGDLHGGLTFTDAVAAALEARSSSGWQEFQSPAGEIWTIIIVNR